MAFVVKDRVRETSATTSTGSFELQGAAEGYQSFASAMAVDDTTYYTIADQSGLNWEVGIGTLTASTTLARTTVIASSNAGSKVDFGSGTKDVFIGLVARSVQDLISPSAGTGLVAQTGTYSFSRRTVTAGTGITVSNGDGVSGDPTVTLTDVIVAAGPTGSTSTIPVITYNARGQLTAVTTATVTPAAIGAVASVTGTANEITVTGTTDATLSLPTALTFTGKTVTGGTFTDPAFAGTITGAVTEVTGTANEITVANGTTTPALSLPTALTFTGKTVTGGTYEGVTALTATTITGTSFVGITLAMISDAGTAAAQDTGTSGATVPLCNGANTWASRQFFMGDFSAGTTATSTANSNGSTPAYLFSGAGLTGAVQVIRHTTMGTGGGLFTMSATRGTDANSYTALQSGDGIGTFLFSGADGTDYVSAAYIQAQVDGTPGANDMPTRMLFATTADGASSPTERLRITSAGAWGLAGTNYGSSGQAIVSNGSASAPTWQSVGLTGSANTWSGAQTFSSTISVASTMTTGGASAATGYTSAGDITLPADRNIRAKNTAKAWINFDGTGTIAARRHFNVSSLTDSGTGVYSVNFTNSVGDNGGVAVSAGSSGARVRADLITNTSVQTGLVSVATSLPGGGLTDPQVITMVVFADNT